MRSSVVYSVTLAAWLGCGVLAAAGGEKAQAAEEDLPEDPEVSAAEDAGGRGQVHRGALSDGPDDPENLLPLIQERRAQKGSLFPVSPLRRLHEAGDAAKEDLYEATHLKLGGAFTHVFQWLSDAVPGAARWGTATTSDVMATWELVDRGTPTQGQAFFHLQGRWEYGTIEAPERLPVFGVGSMIGSANTFSEYVPAVLLRNLYWQQGSQDAGWVYRIGKITPDATLSSSAHIASPLTFLPVAGTGPFANALPDSGLGIAGVWYFSDRVKLMGVFSDANADRFNFGDITAGDFYKAIELGVKIAPRTAKAGYSKLAFWHTDGTKDGEAANGNLGPSGWGFFIKHEQELSADGRAIGILRYGWSSHGSAFYEQQAGAHFLLYDPTGATRLQNDLLGLAVNWALSGLVEGARNEYDVEAFYRFPLFPQVDVTLYYQSIFNPAIDTGIDHVSVFSLRLRTTF